MVFSVKGFMLLSQRLELRRDYLKLPDLLVDRKQCRIQGEDDGEDQSRGFKVHTNASGHRRRG